MNGQVKKPGHFYFIILASYSILSEFTWQLPSPPKNRYCKSVPILCPNCVQSNFGCSQIQSILPIALCAKQLTLTSRGSCRQKLTNSVIPTLCAHIYSYFFIFFTLPESKIWSSPVRGAIFSFGQSCIFIVFWKRFTSIRSLRVLTVDPAGECLL